MKDACPVCGAPLEAVKLSYYRDVLLSAADDQILMGTPDEKDVLWQIYCGEGHRLQVITGDGLRLRD